MIALPMFLYAPALVLLLPAWSGLALLLVAMALTGLLTGPMDVAMFTLRQRRTDPAWMGRAFAVSMSFNYAGFPIGSVLAGLLVTWSLDAAVWFGIVAALLAGAFTILLVPRADPVLEARVDAHLRRIADDRTSTPVRVEAD
jgi:MFS family permease